MSVVEPSAMSDPAPGVSPGPVNPIEVPGAEPVEVPQPGPDVIDPGIGIPTGPGVEPGLPGSPGPIPGMPSGPGTP